MCAAVQNQKQNQPLRKKTKRASTVRQKRNLAAGKRKFIMPPHLKETLRDRRRRHAWERAYVRCYNLGRPLPPMPVPEKG